MFKESSIDFQAGDLDNNNGLPTDFKITFSFSENERRINKRQKDIYYDLSEKFGKLKIEKNKKVSSNSLEFVDLEINDI